VQRYVVQFGVFAGIGFV